MSSAESQESCGSEDLQFDHAEYTSPPTVAVICKTCTRPIPEVYYELNQQILCEPCARGIDASFRGGPKFRRFMKAGFFGFAAAIGASIICYLFWRITNLGFIGIFSLLAGYMV